MCFGNQFPWVSFLRERSWESSDWYQDICWRLGNRTLPCGKHTSQKCCRESAQSILPTVSRGHFHQLLWCLFCKRLSAVFQASWIVAKLRFGYEFLSLLFLNLKQVFFFFYYYYGKFQTYTEIERLLQRIFTAFMFYVSPPTFFLTQSILKKIPDSLLFHL